MKYTIRRPRDGAMLVVALTLSAIVFGAVGIVSQSAIANHERRIQREHRVQARQLVHAAQARADWLTRNHPSWKDNTWVLDPPALPRPAKVTLKRQQDRVRISVVYPADADPHLQVRLEVN